VQEKEIDIDASDICGELGECLSAPSSQCAEQWRRSAGKEKRLAKTAKREEGREHEGGRTQDQVGDPIVAPAPPHPFGQIEEYIRVPLSRVDKLLYLVGEVVINKMKASAMTYQAKKLSKLSKEAQKSISV
jgi:chemotaxis protein histidine kinase CheA